jgi:hypothetical protein
MKKILLIILSLGIYIFFIQLFTFIGFNFLVFGRGVGVITALGGIIPLWTSYKFTSLIWKKYFYPKP